MQNIILLERIFIFISKKREKVESAKVVQFSNLPSSLSKTKETLFGFFPETFLLLFRGDKVSRETTKKA